VINSSNAFLEKTKDMPHITKEEKAELEKLFEEAHNMKIHTAKMMSDWNTKVKLPPTGPSDI